jgi:hypothetical protein
MSWRHRGRVAIEAQGGSDPSPDVDFGALAEEDPIGIDGIDLPFLAFKWLRITLPLGSKMRLTAIAAAFGCTKSTVACGPILKVCQLSERF